MSASFSASSHSLLDTPQLLHCLPHSFFLLRLSPSYLSTHADVEGGKHGVSEEVEGPNNSNLEERR